MIINPRHILSKLKTRMLIELEKEKSPHRIALTISLGFFLGASPLLGFTTILCFLVALGLRLNIIFIQFVGWLLAPVQIIMIAPYLILGDKIFAGDQYQGLISKVKALIVSDFTNALFQFQFVILNGIMAWLLILAPLSFILYHSIVHQLQKRLSGKKV